MSVEDLHHTAIGGFSQVLQPTAPLSPALQPRPASQGQRWQPGARPTQPEFHSAGQAAMGNNQRLSHGFQRPRPFNPNATPFAPAAAGAKTAAAAAATTSGGGGGGGDKPATAGPNRKWQNPNAVAADARVRPPNPFEKKFVNKTLNNLPGAGSAQQRPPALQQQQRQPLAQTFRPQAAQGPPFLSAIAPVQQMAPPSSNSTPQPAAAPGGFSQPRPFAPRPDGSAFAIQAPKDPTIELQVSESNGDDEFFDVDLNTDGDANIDLDADLDALLDENEDLDILYNEDAGDAQDAQIEENHATSRDLPRVTAQQGQVLALPAARNKPAEPRVVPALQQTVYRPIPVRLRESDLEENRRQELYLEREKRRDTTGPAGVIVGTCTEMCPLFEVHDRESLGNNGISFFEYLKGTEKWAAPRIDRDLAVKTFERSGAGKTFFPEDVRTPDTLRRTGDYLFFGILTMDKGTFGQKYTFIRDRCRAMVQDATLQNMRDLLAVEICERYALFLVIGRHRLCMNDLKWKDYVGKLNKLGLEVEVPPDDGTSYDEAQNSKLMCDCLQTLCEIYTELRSKGVVCPNEAEFRSYQVMMLMEGETFAQKMRELIDLPPAVKNSPYITFARNLGAAFHTKDYASFFRLLQTSEYQQQCILHKYANTVRCTALRSIVRAYRLLPLASLQEMFWMETEDEVIAMATYYGIPIDNGKIIFKDLPRKDFIPYPTQFYSRIENSRTIPDSQLITKITQPRFPLPSGFSISPESAPPATARSSPVERPSSASAANRAGLQKPQTQTHTPTSTSPVKQDSRLPLMSLADRLAAKETGGRPGEPRGAPKPRPPQPAGPLPPVSFQPRETPTAPASPLSFTGQTPAPQTELTSSTTSAFALPRGQSAFSRERPQSAFSLDTPAAPSAFRAPAGQQPAPPSAFSSFTKPEGTSAFAHKPEGTSAFALKPDAAAPQIPSIVVSSPQRLTPPAPGPAPEARVPSLDQQRAPPPLAHSVSSELLEARLKAELSHRAQEAEAMEAAAQSLQKGLLADFVAEKVRAHCAAELEAARRVAESRRLEVEVAAARVLGDLVSSVVRSAAKESLMEAREALVPELQRRARQRSALSLWRTQLLERQEAKRKRKEQFVASARQFAMGGPRPSRPEKFDATLSATGKPLDFSDEAALKEDLRVLEMELDLEEARTGPPPPTPASAPAAAALEVMSLSWLPLDLSLCAERRPGEGLLRPWSLGVSTFPVRADYPTDVLFHNWVLKKLGYAKEKVKSKIQLSAFACETVGTGRQVRADGTQQALLNLFFPVSSFGGGHRERAPELSGLVFVLSPVLTRYNQPRYWSEERARLEAFLSVLPPDSSVPLLILHLEAHQTSDQLASSVKERLGLPHPVVSQVQVSQILLFANSGVSEAHPEETLRSSLGWLASQDSQEPLEVEKLALRDLLESSLSNSGFFQALIDVSYCPNPLTDPQQNQRVASWFVDAFNGVLRTVLDMATSRELRHIGDPESNRRVIFSSTQQLHGFGRGSTLSSRLDQSWVEPLLSRVVLPRLVVSRTAPLAESYLGYLSSVTAKLHGQPGAVTTTPLSISVDRILAPHATRAPDTAFPLRPFFEKLVFYLIDTLETSDVIVLTQDLSRLSPLPIAPDLAALLRQPRPLQETCAPPPSPQKKRVLTTTVSDGSTPKKSRQEPASATSPREPLEAMLAAEKRETEHFDRLLVLWSSGC